MTLLTIQANFPAIKNHCAKDNSIAIVKMTDSGLKEAQISSDAQHVESSIFLHNHKDVPMLRWVILEGNSHVSLWWTKELL